jgi:anthranilate synthase component 1
MLWRGGRASVAAGAGVVADSDPDDEDLECHNKARALLTAAAAARRLAPLDTVDTLDPLETGSGMP